MIVLKSGSHWSRICKGDTLCKNLPCRPKLAVENRLCVYCGRGGVEDELYLMLVCSFYLDERIHFLSRILLEQKDFFKSILNLAMILLVKLMSTDNENI